MLLPIWPCCAYSASSKAMSPWLHTLPQHRPAYTDINLKVNTSALRMFRVLLSSSRTCSHVHQRKINPDPCFQTPCRLATCSQYTIAGKC